MGTIEDAILDAWQSIAARFATAPNDLPARLARRRRATLARPPRAWCLALRASDTRLPCPERATRVEGPHPACPELVEGITLDRDAIARLCSPVFLHERQTLAEAARKLGLATTTGLLPARVAGVFEHRYLEGLGGRWGKPRPLIHTHVPLDPAARGFVTADPIWADTAESLVDRLPDSFPTQTLTRIPHYQPRGHGHRDTSGLHPEHPLLDPPHRKRKSLALPKPPPDPLAWYLWKGDEWVGYDWRNPYMKKLHERNERRKERARAAAKRRRRERPALSLSKGSLDFRGHRWLCPHCGRAVNVLFLPLPPINLLAELVPPLKKFDVTTPIRWKLPRERGVTTTFACERCHHVRRFSRCDPNGWNEIISYLTAGLLYGREVKRPEWFPLAKRVDRHEGTKARRHVGNGEDASSSTSCLRASVPSCLPERKIAYTPRPNRAPSIRRPQIEKLLLAGKTFKEIASILSSSKGTPLSKGTVLWTAQQVYKQHGVRTLRELLARHGQPVAPTKKEQVRRRVAEGQSVQQIAREMNISAMSVYNHVYMLRRAGLVMRKTDAEPAVLRTRR